MGPIRKSMNVFGAAVAAIAFSITAAMGTPSYAGERPFRGSPYGESKGYGEKKSVPNPQEARRVIRDYFGGRDVRIGDIREREWHYEADIRDRRNAVVDRVIVDKRTGRIRSTY
jgi:hypothetical protein